MTDDQKLTRRAPHWPSLSFRPRSPLLGYGFILPSLLMLLLVLGLPVGTAVLNSFTPLWGEAGGLTLDNYRELSRDELFWNSLKVTGVFVGSTVLLHFFVGLAVALALTTEIRGKKFFRVVAILPWTIPDVISGLIWRFMYNPTSGIINHSLHQLNITDEYIEWLGKTDLGLASVIFADVWRGYPFVMLILLAGLQAIPKELYEAVQVDGANILQEFRHITLPGIARVVGIALALDMIWQFRRFGLVYNMTFGGPGHSTEILPFYIYKQYFRYFNFEYASAIAVVSAIIMLIASLPYIYLITRRV